VTSKATPVTAVVVVEGSPQWRNVGKTQEIDGNYIVEINGN